jgi:hypothetical protein
MTKNNYQVWAITDNGDGAVTSLGEYEDVEDIVIHVGAFSKDVVITIEQIYEANHD